MARYLITVFRARKPHTCWNCKGLIPVGTRYKRVAVPPGSELGNDMWMAERVHTDCG